MKDFALVDNITGAYPSVAAINCSGSATTDGTPLVADWVNNIWGALQDLLSRGGITPSGVVEAYAAETGALPLGTTATQVRTALQRTFGSPGEIVLWCRNQDPATVGARILLLQGQVGVVIANYKDLVAATYCGDGVNNTPGVPFYKSSDAGGVTRSTSGTYFNLPDARGCTIRGIAGDITRDPDALTRGAGTPNGSIQVDAFQGHAHDVRLRNGNYLDDTGAYAGGSNMIRGQAGSPTVGVYAATPEVLGAYGAPRYAFDTRMWNMACHIGIRY